MRNFNKVRKMTAGGSAYFGQTDPLAFFNLKGITLNQNVYGSTIPVSAQTVPTIDGKESFGDKMNNFADAIGLTKDGKLTKGAANTMASAAKVGADYVNQNMYYSDSQNLLGQVADALSSVPGLGPASSLIKSGFNFLAAGLGSELDKFSMDLGIVERIGGSYTGAIANMNKAQQMSGKTAIFGGHREGSNSISKAQTQKSILANIDADNLNRLTMSANTLLNHLRYGQTLNGGIDARYLRMGKLGIKLEILNRLQTYKTPQIVNINTKQVEEFKQEGTITEPIDKFKEGGIIDFNPIIYSYTDPIETDVEFIPIISEEVCIFKDGGKTEETELVKLEETNLKNVIPEGALHKNKHHIENTEGLTLKGIPIIDNDGEQLAEIELDEIIFTLEVTKKLEELHKLYKEGTNKEQDEAAIEAGKLLVQEILYNTDDRTGLISKCKEGGKING